jgi:hypothetical protein
MPNPPTWIVRFEIELLVMQLCWAKQNKNFKNDSPTWIALL